MPRRALGAAALVAAGASCGDNVRPSFHKQTLDSEFRSEGVAIFDVDHDGHPDLVTDEYWYAGPSFTAAHELRDPEVYDPFGYSHDMSAWGDDIDGDGWKDLVVAPFPTDAMYWYENPRDPGAHWPAHLIAPALGACVETQRYEDLFGDGKRVAIMGFEAEGILSWYERPADPRAPWLRHPISTPGFGGAYRFAHGLGVGDVDGDGRLDVLTTAGWFQQTADRDAWPFHPLPIGPDPCSNMYALDVDGDHLADILCAHPHSYGIDWWQQLPDGSFVQHGIDDSVSELGALGLADLDGDGTPELVTGKNYWAHPCAIGGYCWPPPDGDPGVHDAPELEYFELRPGPVFVRHVIDDASGIGRQVTIGDLDGDGRPDIVESSKLGLFVFRQP